MIMIKWTIILDECWNVVCFHPTSFTLWGRRTSQRCCSVSSWLRIKTCTVEILTWTSLDFFTEKSGSCSPNAAPLTPGLTPPPSILGESWRQVNYTFKSDRFILYIPRENSAETVVMRDDTVRTLTIQSCLFWLASCKLTVQPSNNHSSPADVNPNNPMSGWNSGTCVKRTARFLHSGRRLFMREGVGGGSSWNICAGGAVKPRGAAFHLTLAIQRLGEWVVAGNTAHVHFLFNGLSLSKSFKNSAHSILYITRHFYSI